MFARLKYPGGVCPNKQTGVSIPRQSEKWRAKVYETWLIGNLGRAGVSELGQIAGAGMLVAYITSITVLPALLYVLHPPGEQDTLGNVKACPGCANCRVATIAPDKNFAWIASLDPIWQF